MLLEHITLTLLSVYSIITVFPNCTVSCVELKGGYKIPALFSFIVVLHRQHFHQTQNQCSENKAVLFLIPVTRRAEMDKTFYQQNYSQKTWTKSSDAKKSNKRCQGRKGNKRKRQAAADPATPWMKHVYRNISLQDAQKTGYEQQPALCRGRGARAASVFSLLLQQVTRDKETPQSTVIKSLKSEITFPNLWRR